MKSGAPHVLGLPWPALPALCLRPPNAAASRDAQAARNNWMRSPLASKSASARCGSAAAPRSLARTSAATSTPLTCSAREAEVRVRYNRRLRQGSQQGRKAECAAQARLTCSSGCRAGPARRLAHAAQLDRQRQAGPGPARREHSRRTPQGLCGGAGPARKLAVTAPAHDACI